MANCATCNKVILFGGSRDGSERFCSSRCRDLANTVRAAATIPAETVREAAEQIRRAACPKCGRRGGLVDLHLSHSVYSLLVITRWKSTPFLSCSPCAKKRQILDLLLSLTLGWWGFPWGLLVTPLQVCRNLIGLLSRETIVSHPSPALEHFVRLRLITQRPAPDLGAGPVA